MVKILSRIVVTLSLLFSFHSLQASKGGYEIRIKFKNLTNSRCFLGLYYGNNKYISDTAVVDESGTAVFKGSVQKPGGVYLVVIPSKNYFEFILNEPKISFEADTTDFIGNLKVITSDENKVFYNFLQTSRRLSEERSKYSAILKKFKDEKDSIAFYKKKMSVIDSQFRKFRSDIIAENPGLFFIKILKAMDEPNVRDKKPGEADSTYNKFAYNWYQAHYFDNVDFSDQRMLRTPVFEGKIDRFMEDMTIKQPDSIKYAAARVIDRSMADTNVFRFCLTKLFNNYGKFEFLGSDIVFVYLAERYFLSGLAFWTDSSTLTKMRKKVDELSPNLPGKNATNLIIPDSNGLNRALFDFKSTYRILVFWSPECSHCRAEIPVLAEWYEKHSKDSFSVYAVEIDTGRAGWIKFIREHKLKWINVFDPGNLSGFRKIYDVYMTPVIYIIDKKRIIRAKNFPIEEIDKVILMLNHENK